MIRLNGMGWRNLLLQTSAITAVGVAVVMAPGQSAKAADQEVTAGNAVLAPGAANTIVNAANANTDTGQFDINGNVTWGSNTVKSVDFSTLGGVVYSYDSAAGSADTATFDGDVSITAGQTLTFNLGNTQAAFSGGGAQTNGAVILDFNDATNTDVFMAGSTADTRGGNVSFVGENNVNRSTDGSRSHTVNVDGKVKLTTLTLTGGNAGAGDGSGDSISATFGNAAADTFDVTGLTLTGGNAFNNLTANRGLGGAVSATVNGTATVGATGITVQGGAAGSSAAAGNVGGNAGLSFNQAATLSGAVTVAGGNKDGNNGGDAAITFAKDVTSTSTLALTTGGAGGGGAGTAGDASATFGGNVTFGGTGITMTQTAAAGGTVGSPSVTFNGTAAQSVTGAVTGGGAGQGALTVSNTGGRVTFNNSIGAVSLASVTTNANSNVKFNSTVGAVAMTLNGRTEFDDAVTVGTGALTIANGVILQVGNQIVNGETLFTTTNAATNFSAGAVVLRMPSNFTAGTITLIDDTATNISGRTGQFGVVDTALTDFTVQSNAGDNTKMDVVASQKSASQTASELGSHVNEARAMGAAVNGNSGDNTIIDAYTTALYAGAAEGKKAAEQSIADPTGGGAVSRIVQTNAQTSFNITSARLESVRSGAASASGATGVASGGMATKGVAWMKAHANLTDQGMRDGVYGYEAWTAGMMAGMDGNVADNTRLGVSAGYAYTDMDSDSSSKLNQSINSYQVAVYGDYTADTWYVEATAGYSFNTVESSRRINFGGLNLTAKGDYNTNQYMTAANVGMPLHMAGGHVVTPIAGLAYTYLDGGKYTETGAGGLNQTVDIESTQALVAKLGVKYNAVVPAGSGNLVPELRAAALYDLIGDEARSVNSFAGGTSYTTEGADAARLGGLLGVGLTYAGENDMWSVGLAYDAEIREDFLAHNGQVQTRVRF